MPRASQIADFLGEDLHGEDLEIVRAATLDSVAPGAVVFLNRYDRWDQVVGIAGILTLLRREGADEHELTGSYILCDNPRFAFGQVLREFFAKERSPRLIAPTAVIDPSAKLGENVRIGHYSVVGPNVVIDDNSEIRSHVCIARDVKIGRDCLIKSGAVLGEEGFGFEKDELGVHTRIPHIGGVRIGDRVEIGALTSVCCGTVDDTVIGDDTKIDDHVFIAHNVQVGRNVIIIAASEVSGSVKLRDDVWVAPSVTIINGVEIGERALLGTGAVITKPVEARAVMGGARATFLRYIDESRDSQPTPRESANG